MCHSVGPAGYCLRSSHDDGVTLEEVCLLPSDSGGERLGCFCHYSDRQNGELPPQPGGTKDDSGGVKEQRRLCLILRPYRLKSDCTASASVCRQLPALHQQMSPEPRQTRHDCHHFHTPSEIFTLQQNSIVPV